MTIKMIHTKDYEIELSLDLDGDYKVVLKQNDIGMMNTFFRTESMAEEYFDDIHEKMEKKFDKDTGVISF